MLCTTSVIYAPRPCMNVNKYLLWCAITLSRTGIRNRWAQARALSCKLAYQWHRVTRESRCFRAESHVKSQVAHWSHKNFNGRQVTSVTTGWILCYYGNYMSDAESWLSYSETESLALLRDTHFWHLSVLPFYVDILTPVSV